MWEYERLVWSSGVAGYYPGTSVPETWKIEGGDAVWHGMMDALRDLGAAGWEAVGVVVLPGAVYGVPLSQYVLLKRQVQ
jgi:hypothetical protein